MGAIRNRSDPPWSIRATWYSNREGGLATVVVVVFNACAGLIYAIARGRLGRLQRHVIVFLSTKDHTSVFELRQSHFETKGARKSLWPFARIEEIYSGEHGFSEEWVRRFAASLPQRWRAVKATLYHVNDAAVGRGLEIARLNVRPVNRRYLPFGWNCFTFSRQVMGKVGLELSAIQMFLSWRAGSDVVLDLRDRSRGRGAHRR